MEYLEFAGSILIVLIFYIVTIKIWMFIADFIGKKLGISKLIYILLNKFTGKDHDA
ncbi:MAG: hypothetical protein K8R73_12190 [Clostridiales bacterium]|nr:hypothetical protein [Clostridiales bacterium]